MLSNWVHFLFAFALSVSLMGCVTTQGWVKQQIALELKDAETRMGSDLAERADEIVESRCTTKGELVEVQGELVKLRASVADLGIALQGAQANLDTKIANGDSEVRASSLGGIAEVRSLIESVQMQLDGAVVALESQITQGDQAVTNQLTGRMSSLDVSLSSLQNQFSGVQDQWTGRFQQLSTEMLGFQNQITAGWASLQQSNANWRTGTTQQVTAISDSVRANNTRTKDALAALIHAMEAIE